MNEKTYIVAEMAWGHDGSCDQAIELMQAAKDAGADAISIHITYLEDYMVPHYGSGAGRVSAGKEHLAVYKYLDDINLSEADWVRFCGAARDADIDICIMPNDLASVSFSEAQLKPEYFVLAASTFAETDLLIEIARSNRPCLFRIGGATLGEIEEAVQLFRANGDGQITLLHGFQNYPTEIGEINIRQLSALKEMFDCNVGLADHIDGADPVAKVVPVAALAFGSSCIEKHLTLDRSKKSEDFEAALDPEDFAEFVRNIRASELALGAGAWRPLTPAALRYRDVSRKRMVAAGNLEEGATISREDIVFKRSDVGLYPSEVSGVVGRVLKRSMSENEGIELGDLV